MESERQQEVSALVEELAELARRAPARLGERVAALGIREQAELALRLPARHRLELLLHAPKLSAPKLPPRMWRPSWMEAS